MFPRSADMARARRRWTWFAVILGALVVAGRAEAQSVRLSVERHEVYADVPFVLAVTAEGFEEEPEPEVSEPVIPGANVRFLDVSPSVQQSITVVNGRRKVRRDVSFVYRYRVEVSEPGRYEIERVEVTQGDARARSQPEVFRARDVETTKGMRLELELPEREVRVGEVFDATIDWYLRREPRNQLFAVPLFDHEAFEVEAPDNTGESPTLDVPAGDGQLELPYESEQVTVEGEEFTRVRFRARVRPTDPGRHELDPPMVVAQLETGTRRDGFGFRTRRAELFKAAGDARSLEVAPLPVSGRPPSFAGAVGQNFGLEVRAGRTVVSVGEPIELAITLRGSGDLEGLSLPPLRDAGLPEAFEVPDELPPGELKEGGREKRFRAVVRLSDPDVREIPALELAYFDPEAGEYRKARSEPIALSVEGSSVVGAQQVIGGDRGSDEDDDPAASGGPGETGADLALSASGETMRPAPSLSRIAPLVAALYVAPLVVLGFRLWQLRSAKARGARSVVRAARREVDALVSRADTEPARDLGPALLRALEALARATGGRLDPALVEHLEIAPFDPRAAELPLDESSRVRVRDAAAALCRAPDARPRGRRAASAALVLVALAPPAFASGDTPALEEARAQYREALAEADRQARIRVFARAEETFRELAAAHPDRPELLADWGNAALGARDRGRAVLAYRRALALDPGLDRARINLQWAREGRPDWLPAGGAEDSPWTSWHRNGSAPTRHLLAAAAFAVAVLLLTPWPTRRRRLLRGLAALPAAIAIAMWASFFLEPDHRADVVVLAADEPLRSADSGGAPTASPKPLPAGAEAALRETRDGWARIALPGGEEGWVREAALALVATARALEADDRPPRP